MKFSEAGSALLKESEGFSAHAYLDVVGVPTIGYGHRIIPPESFPQGITEAQAAAMLAGDVEETEHAIARLVKVPLTQGQFDALVDFTYNLGAGRLAESTLLQDLNAGRYYDAAVQLLRWDHAGMQVNAGLERRREAEYKLWTGHSPGKGM